MDEWTQFCDSCGFMQPVIEYGGYFRIETRHGTWIVPADVCSAATQGGFSDYVEAEIDEPDEPAELLQGWLCRMSAPGYMDCTDWCAFDTEEEAQQYLIDTYGE